MSKQGTWTLGDAVCVQGQTVPGTVVRISNQVATVAFSAFTLQIATDKLVGAPTSAQPTTSSTPRSNVRVLHQNPNAFLEFEPVIDLHGMRVHEALSAIEHWVDQALLSGHKHLRVIHGKGTGTLRHAVKKHLQGQSVVKRIIDKHPYPGGEGVTWLELH